MGTKILDYTITSSYFRLDDSITAADEYWNVRDQQRVRLNHNILLARRVRQPILTLAMRDGDGANTDGVFWKTLIELMNTGGNPFLTVPIAVSPQTKELELVIYTGATSALTVYPAIQASGTVAGYPSEDQSMTLVSSSRNAMTIQVHQSVLDSDGIQWFSLYASSAQTGADTKGGPHASILSWDTGWVETDDATGNTGESIYFPSNTWLLPRLITSTEATAGGQKYYVERPFGPFELNGVSDANYRLTTGMEIQTLCLYEVAVTDFTTDTEPSMP